jgi:YidC/Oxa1 family membrane protein insertase
MAKKKNKQPVKEQPKKVFNFRFFLTYFLLFISTWMLMRSCEQQKQLKEQVAKEQKIKDSIAKAKKDSIQKVLETSASADIKEAEKLLGDFSYNLVMDSVSPAKDITIENKLFKAVLAKKGGYFKKFELKKYKRFDSLPLYLINKNNAHLNLVFKTKDGKELNTSLLDFHPELKKEGENTIVSMKLYAGPDKYLEYEYIFRPNEYMFDFNIRTKNMEGIILSDSIPLHWELKAFRHEKGIAYENQFTTIKYEYEDGKTDKLSPMKEEDEEDAEDVDWVDYKQHFFSTFLISSDKHFKKAHLKQINLAKSKSDTLTYTKHFFTDTYLNADRGNLSYKMKMYYGPNDYKLLSSYDLGIEEVIPLGWGIFGWVNKWFMMPLFNLLSSKILNYGLVIILMTIIIRLLVSPLTYKTYLSQAKNKILKPEIDELNKKYKDNPAKRQKEVMALQSKAGVSPMAGCLPSLIFLPIFYALFRFFPSAIGLRQKGFLWVDDLSSYEEAFHLPFKIPMFGETVSIFAILAAITMFIYMKMNMSAQSSMSMPQQEGMPDMQKMMKWMFYISPIMMLVFFNRYAAGLSLYYFISNLMTIIILLVIKKFVIDEDKIRNIIEENKKKPKKQGRFARKMAELMEKAEEQKRLQEEMKKKRGKK